MTQFSSLGLAEPILRAVTAEGYETPTPIQAQAIPVLLQRRDVLGIAQTGTGKTAAFVLPMLHHLSAEATPLKPRACRAVILAPTRELAAQIAESIRAYGRFLRLSVAVIVGGVKPGPQIRQMARGVDIVVATPGRLLDHVNTGALSLGEARIAVLDEADQMLDLGFIPDIRRLMAKLPAARQTLLFSATMPKPIRALADDFLRDPLDIAVAQVSRPAELIDQHVVMIDNGGNKRAALIALLREYEVERGIIFTRTKHGADKLCKQLEAAGFAAAAIHGNKSQPQRERALAAFRSGAVNLMIATDIAARGIDIDGVSHVFNFELPHVPESYVHRIGRTARAGASGVAFSLCAPDERPLLRAIERLIGRKIAARGVSAEAANVPDWTPLADDGNSPRRDARKPHAGRFAAHGERRDGAVSGRHPPGRKSEQRQGEQHKGEQHKGETRFGHSRKGGHGKDGARDGARAARPHGERTHVAPNGAKRRRRFGRGNAAAQG